ncbi:hypothetical protein XELAEV_18013968mg [Xenopus laevis]|uniref:Uncharacterized protein n=1 Tax=Xenopus laevis TaxID=8355 RepID=A0A974DQW0_XENLA|nr:hypothetical protein XELAEV_18013968mg [Xenopus laevis]
MGSILARNLYCLDKSLCYFKFGLKAYGKCKGGCAAPSALSFLFISGLHGRIPEVRHGTLFIIYYLTY